MQTDCSADGYEFEAFAGRRVVAAFDGGALTSDAGVLLLRQADRAIGLLERVAGCFHDGRKAEQIEHGLATLVGQRIVGLALGYEDLNDHDELRHDPALMLFSDKLSGRRSDCAALAGKSTLNRLEHAPAGTAARYHKIGHDAEALAALFVALFIEAQARPPAEIVLDLDATDDLLHGHQEGRFFHGYYGGYCYLPLYVFCGRHLLCAKLRPANIDAAAGARQEIARIVAQIRAHWPEVAIVLRADAGFARDDLMTWCEDNGVDYVFGLARNKRLVARLQPALDLAAARGRDSGQPARLFTEFRYRTLKTWSRRRRVVGKAEWLPRGANPRFVVTSLPRSEIDRRRLYETLYCARGEMENRIKECQLDLFADRTSTRSMKANQLRLWFASFAYLLIEAVRRLGLKHSALENASCGSIRLKLFKLAARVTVSVRRIKLSMASAHPHQHSFAHAHQRLAAAAA